MFLQDLLDTYGVTMTLADVCQTLKKSKSRVYTQISNGTFPIAHAKVGGHLVFRTRDVAHYLESQWEGADAPTPNNEYVPNFKRAS